MANYSDIKGTTISSTSSDPSNTIDGQVWYNSSTFELKMEGGNYGSAPFTFGTLAPLPERKATSAGGGSKDSGYPDPGQRARPHVRAGAC